MVGYFTAADLIDNPEAESLLLNKVWEQQALLGNHFYPQQGVKVPKNDTAATVPFCCHGNGKSMVLV
jgi:hypothetical protein